jgi:hypothetical protein
MDQSLAATETAVIRYAQVTLFAEIRSLGSEHHLFSIVICAPLMRGGRRMDHYPVEMTSFCGGVDPPDLVKV